MKILATMTALLIAVAPHAGAWDAPGLVPLPGATVPTSDEDHVPDESDAPYGDLYVIARETLRDAMGTIGEDPTFDYDAAKAYGHADVDRNGYGDAWERQFHERKDDLILKLNDPDGDRLPNVDEFRWLTVPIGPLGVPGVIEAFPQAPDFDFDNWRDGPEVQYWDDVENNDVGRSPSYTYQDLALVDPDSLLDLDGDGFPNHQDPDADGDGLIDGSSFTVEHPSAASESIESRSDGTVLFTDETVDGVTFRTYYGEASFGTRPDAADSDCRVDATECRRPQNHHSGAGSAGAPGTGDGLADGEELAFWQALAEDAVFTDYDGDGGTSNLQDPDADGDGLLDGAEVKGTAGAVTAPHRLDSDEDGLLDGHSLTLPAEDARFDGIARTEGSGAVTYHGELTIGTLADNADSDGDQALDGWEVQYAFGPLNASDGALDPDGDGLANWAESLAGTDPRDADSDNDGLTDGDEERVHGTDPANADSDGDGMPDGWEARYALNPLDASDADLDADRDGGRYGPFPAVEEYRHARPIGWDASVDGVWWNGTDPWERDSDGDGTVDGEEGFPRAGAADVDTNDHDQDGLPDSRELRIGTAVRNADTDGDGVCDGGRGLACVNWATAEGAGPGEVNDYGSNPFVPDSDGDGLTDGVEARTFDARATGRTNASDVDTLSALVDPDQDDDGLSDGEEHALGSNAQAADSDADGLSDAEEVRPTEWRAVPSDPTRADSDEDGLLDGDERVRRTDPVNADTDRDNLTDLQETERGTDPLLWDSDRDGMPDGWEVEYGLDPLVRDADLDADLDGLVSGLTNGAEYAYGKPASWSEFRDGVWWNGTNPTDYDTDGDLIDDFWEHATGFLDPRYDDSAYDEDVDDASHLVEYVVGSNPRDPDTDGDGLTDGEEITAAEYVARPEVRELMIVGPALEDAGVSADDAVPERVHLPPDPDVDALPEGLIVRSFPLGIPNLVVNPKSVLLPIVVLSQPTAIMPSDPVKRDSDDDGIPDGAEREYWDALGPDAWRTNYRGREDSVRATADGVVKDANAATPVGTPISNLREPDADGDGLDDGQEILVYRTHAWTWDTDGDGASDYEEVARCGTDPTSDESACGTAGSPRADSDGDGWSDFEESSKYGTDPLKVDSDGDGLDDVTEWAAWSTRGDPLSLPDKDGDGIAHPLLDADWDGDGLGDGVEFGAGALPRSDFYVTAPDDEDTDGDDLLDGEESHNDFTVDAAQCARQSATFTARYARAQVADEPSSTAWVLDPSNACLRVAGAFGVTLFHTRVLPVTVPMSGGGGSNHDPSGASGPKRVHATESNPDHAQSDKDDTDEDLLTDGAEKERWKSSSNAVDTDGDGLTDPFEAYYFGKAAARTDSGLSNGDTDGDRDPDIADADSDGDGLTDGSEVASSPWGWVPNPTEPLDADTDDDGLLDSTELNEPANADGERLDPAHPDSDEDGIPDGTEMGLVVPETDDLGKSWTRTDRLLCDGDAIGRFTKPNFGGDGALDIALDEDSDDDGLLDGWEDWNANGLFGAADPEKLPRGVLELNPLDPDFDNDKLSDGAEVMEQVVSKLGKFCDLLKKFPSGPTFVYELAHNTNPWEADTDGDNITDGLDINPRDKLGKASGVVELLLENWLQSDPIDLAWDDAKKYEPELSLKVQVRTVAGTATFELQAPEKGRVKSGPLAGQLVLVSGAKGIVDDAPELVGGNRVRIQLQEDISQYGSNPLSVYKVALRIHAVDQDDRYDDVIDISRREAQSRSPWTDEGREYVASDDQPETDRDAPSLDLMRPSTRLVADGNLDEQGGDDDDDARLSFSFKSLLDGVLLKRARAVSNLGDCQTYGPNEDTLLKDPVGC